MIQIKPLVDSILSQMENDPKLKAQIGMAGYIREYRTITLGLPRRSGKSTYLSELHDEESSLLFTMNELMKQIFSKNNKRNLSIRTFRELDNMLFSGRIGYGFENNYGLKYTCFLVDESNFMTKDQRANFYELIASLDRAKLIHKNFYVLMLTT